MDEELIVNIDKCIEDRSIPAVIREVFETVRDHEYLSASNFFETVSDRDLEMLVEMADDLLPDNDVSDENRDDAYTTLSLLAIGLLVGEGRELTENSCTEAIKIVVGYIACESLARKGLIKAIRKNWTMGLETPDAPIAEKL